MTYYNYKSGTSIGDVVSEWKRGNRLYDEDCHAVFSANDLWPYREYTRTRTNGRCTPKEWDALYLKIAEHGWNKKHPAIVLVGKNGNVLVGEGNHRLAIAHELGLPVPVRFEFRQQVDRQSEEAERRGNHTHIRTGWEGTCPVCFNIQRLSGPNGTMVHHGFTRPGDGFTHGRCFGCDLTPFEISPEGTKIYRAALQERLATKEKELQDLVNGKIRSLLRMPSEYERKYHGAKSVTFTADETDFGRKSEWKRLLDTRIRETKRNIDYDKRDIQILTAKIDSWVKKPISEITEEVINQVAADVKAKRDTKAAERQAIKDEKAAKAKERQDKEAAAETVIHDFYLSWAPRFIELAGDPTAAPKDGIPSAKTQALLIEMRAAAKKAKLKGHSKDHLWPNNVDRAIKTVTGHQQWGAHPTLTNLGLMDTRGIYSSFLSTQPW